MQILPQKISLKGTSFYGTSGVQFSPRICAYTFYLIFVETFKAEGPGSAFHWAMLPRDKGEGHEILSRPGLVMHRWFLVMSKLEFIPCNNQRIYGQMTTRMDVQQTALMEGQMWLWGHKEDNGPHLGKSICIFPARKSEHFAAANLEW